MTRPGYHASPRDQWIADEIARANRSDLTVDRRPGNRAAHAYLMRHDIRAARRGTIRAALALGVIVAGLMLLAVGAGL